MADQEQNNSLSFIMLETRTAKLVIRFGGKVVLSRGYFLKYRHLAIPNEFCFLTYAPPNNSIAPFLRLLPFTLVACMWEAKLIIDYGIQQN